MLAKFSLPAIGLALTVTGTAAAQTPLPFPKPGQPQKPPAQAPATEPQPAGQQATVAPPRPAGAPPQTPTQETLGLPIYPTATFITSYDAGKGQRYYLFGTNATYVEIVAYYRSILKQRGNEVFEEPPVHTFEVGRFREQTMAFPPGITVKDYTWGGLEGYLVPQRGAPGVRYKTIIQVVPPPPGADRR